MNSISFEFRCLLLDLDGTLLDTGPDMGAAVNIVRAELGLPGLDYQTIRPHVSNGSMALTRLGSPDPEGSAGFDWFRQRFLEAYREHIAVKTTMFDGMDRVLDRIERAGVPWGIVTNKPAWLTDPLLASLDLAERPACVISGDTTAHMKPHPRPLLEAAARADVAPAQCVYVGDAARDIEAGRAAAMFTIAACFGYLVAGDDPQTWGADAIVEDTARLYRWCDEQLAA